MEGRTDEAGYRVACTRAKKPTGLLRSEKRKRREAKKEGEEGQIIIQLTSLFFPPSYILKSLPTCLGTVGAGCGNVRLNRIET